MREAGKRSLTVAAPIGASISSTSLSHTRQGRGAGTVYESPTVVTCRAGSDGARPPIGRAGYARLLEAMGDSQGNCNTTL